MKRLGHRSKKPIPIAILYAQQLAALEAKKEQPKKKPATKKTAVPVVVEGKS